MLVQAIRRSPLLRIAIDLRVTVICLALLFLLTLLGTFHQVSHGLYDAQQRYFGAWITLVGGIVPLPGAQLVLWVLFVNLVAVTAVRFVYRWSRVGILIIHLGMFVMFFGMFLRSLWGSRCRALSRTAPRRSSHPSPRARTSAAPASPGSCARSPARPNP